MTAGFRIQQRPVDYFDKNSKIEPKCRLFIIYSGVITLFEEQFHTIVNYLAKADTLYFTGKTGEQYGLYLKKVFSKSSKLLGSDLSGFDSTISVDLIISSYCLIELSFIKMTSKQKRLLTNLCKYFCVAHVVVNHPSIGNISFTKYSGVPSGSVFTNLIDTFAHLIVISSEIPSLVDDKKLVVCGDDIIMDISHLPELTIAQMKIHYMNEGLEMSPVASKLFTKPKEIFFLGHFWLNFEKHIHVKLALNNIVWHSDFETKLTTFERVVARSVSILANGKNGKSVFYKIFPELFHEIKKNPSKQVLIYLAKVGFFGSGDPTSNLSNLKEVKVKQVNLKRLIEKGYLKA